MVFYSLGSILSFSEVAGQSCQSSEALISCWERRADEGNQQKVNNKEKGKRTKETKQVSGIMSMVGNYRQFYITSVLEIVKLFIP